MAFVNCVLAMCDTPGCKSKATTPLLKGPLGPGASLPEGWVSSPLIMGNNQSIFCDVCQRPPVVPDIAKNDAH